MFENIIHHIGRNICVKYWKDGEAKVTAGVLTDYEDFFITINNNDILYFFDQNMTIMSIVDSEDNFLYRIEDLEDEFPYVYDNYTPPYMSDDIKYLMETGINEIHVDRLPEWLEFIEKYCQDPKIIQIVILMLHRLNAGLSPLQAEFLVYGKDFDLRSTHQMTTIETKVSEFIKDEYAQSQYVDYINSVHKRTNGINENPKKLILQLNHPDGPTKYYDDRFKKRK